MINDKIFKAYDVRGIYPSEIDEKTVYAIARGYAVWRSEEMNKKSIKVVLGRDMRLSSLVLYQSAKQGLLDQGVKVIEIDLTSTPTFYFAVCHLQADGGLIISASHNPKEYNGIKMVRANAEPIGLGNGMEEIMNYAKLENWPQAEIEGEAIEYHDIIEEQVNYEKLNIDLDKIKSFKVVVDTANAMGAMFIESLFKQLPQIELIKMNFDLDGSFPAHEADPFKEENVADLKKRVLMERADLGIATDGDGDRIFFIDNKGNLVEPAIIRAIFSKIFLRENPGAKICFDVRPGKITEETILANGGVPVMTKVGHSFIKKQMIQEDAVFGGESSGHFFVKFPWGTYEAPMVIIIKLLIELSDSGVSLSDYIKPYQKYYHSGELNFKVRDTKVIIERIREVFVDAQINELDGLSVSYVDFWFNIRTSNTESLLRLNVEGINQETVDKKVEILKQLIGG